MIVLTQGEILFLKEKDLPTWTKDKEMKIFNFIKREENDVIHPVILGNIRIIHGLYKIIFKSRNN